MSKVRIEWRKKICIAHACFQIKRVLCVSAYHWRTVFVCFTCSMIVRTSDCMYYRPTYHQKRFLSKGSVGTWRQRSVFARWYLRLRWMGRFHWGWRTRSLRRSTCPETGCTLCCVELQVLKIHHIIIYFSSVIVTNWVP